MQVLERWSLGTSWISLCRKTVPYRCLRYREGFISMKKTWIAAALALFLGWLGVHKFYLGKTNAGIVMLLCSIPGAAFVIPALIVWAIAFIEAVLYLVKDEQTFYDEYVIGNRNWF